MAIPKFLEDLLIISKLGDNPGSDNGLSSSGLRAKFDEAGVKIQQYINNTLIPALSELADPTAGLNMKGNISMGGHRVTGVGNPVENGDAVPLGYAKKISNPHNLLDNSDFRNPVNQRGLKDYLQQDNYTIDRWKIYATNGSPGLSVMDGYILFKGGIYQKLDIDASKTYTFAVMTGNNEILCVSGVPTIPVTATKGNNTIVLGRDYSNNLVQVGVAGVNEAIIDSLKWAALYEGEYTEETLPKYQTKESCIKLLACQTQLQRFRTEEDRKTYCEDFRPPMRMTPTGIVSKFEQVVDGVTYYFASAEA
jgi:hypothetical protein